MSDDEVCKGGKFSPFVTAKGVFANVNGQEVTIRSSSSEKENCRILERQALPDLQKICYSIERTGFRNPIISPKAINSNISYNMLRYRRENTTKPFASFHGFTIPGTDMHIGKNPSKSNFSQLLNNIIELKITVMVVHVVDEAEHKNIHLFANFAKRENLDLKLYIIDLSKKQLNVSYSRANYFFEDYHDKKNKIESMREIAELARQDEQILFCCTKGDSFSVLSCILVRMTMRFEHTIGNCTTQEFEARYYDELKHIFKYVQEFNLPLKEIAASIKNMMLIFGINKKTVEFTGELSFCNEEQWLYTINKNARRDVSDEFIKSLKNYDDNVKNDKEIIADTSLPIMDVHTDSDTEEITNNYNRRRPNRSSFWDCCLVKMIWNEDRDSTNGSPLGCLSKK